MIIQNNSYTMKEIAKELGISTTTIWRAVNNKNGISKKTKKRILNILKSRGYSKNLIASHLRKKSSNTIGVIFSDIENPFYAAALKGIEKVCVKNGFNIIFSITHEDYLVERNAIKLLLEKRVDGLIIVPVENSEYNLDIIEKMNIPTTFLARYIKKYGGNRVVFGDFKAGYIATSHLLKKGHKNIAYIAGPPKISATEDRLEGYQKALLEHGIVFNPDYAVIIKKNVINQSKDATLKLLQKHKEITAIFAYCDYLALGSIEAIQSLKLKIPKDVAVIGCDDVYFNKFAGLTSISFPKEKMGKLSAEILLKQINYQGQNDYNMEKKNIVICDPKLMVRSTT